MCRSAAEDGDGVGTESIELEERKKTHAHFFWLRVDPFRVFFLLPGMMKVKMFKLDLKYQIKKEIP